MRSMRRIPYRGFALVVALSLATTGALAGQSAAASKEQADDAAAIKKFMVRVDEYMKLRTTIEK